DRSRVEAFDIVVELGLDAVELGAGEFVPDWHLGLDEVISDRPAAEALKKDLSSRGLILSALSCHANPLHPNPVEAKRADECFRKTVKAAEILEVDCICLFAGCPGSPDGDEYPNWVICGWPPYFLETLEWQWSERIIPYWSEAATFAAKHNIRLAFEMHTGDCG